MVQPSTLKFSSEVKIAFFTQGNYNIGLSSGGRKEGKKARRQGAHTILRYHHIYSLQLKFNIHI